MKIVRVLGGLGNQMFQYAFYKALQKKHPRVLADLSLFKDYQLHSGFELEKIFGIHMQIASSFSVNLYDTSNKLWLYNKLRKLLSLRNTYQEEVNEFSFDSAFLHDPKPRLYYGYWQNEQYFSDLDMRAEFEFKPPLSKRNKEISNHIKNSQSISIHVRRGDYVSHPLLGNICDLHYYHSAISLINAKIDDPIYFIFSNDITWCKENLQIKNAIYVDWNIGRQSYVDMQLMSYAKHQIIANSSFSWWGAWLNQNPGKIVIAPKKWTNTQQLSTSEILPKTWISI